MVGLTMTASSDNTLKRKREETPASILVPRPVLPFAPLRQDERQHYLKLLNDQYLKLRYKNHVGKAVKLEYQVAAATKSKMDYLSKVKRMMFNLNKYGSIEPTKTDPSSLGNSSTTSGGRSSNKRVKVDDTNTVTTDDDNSILNELRKMCIAKDTLVRHGFAVAVPDPKPYPDVVDCAHCQNPFSISKEYRTENKTGVNKTVCKFHPGKIKTSLNSNLTKYNREYSNRYYSCCDSIPGETEGCQILNHHVYKLKTINELQHHTPFRKIADLIDDIQDSYDPLQANNRIIGEKHAAIALDCEMCYTTKGFELMKLSVCSFPSLKTLLDEVIKPEGEIIDLNTHVSGVYEIPKDAMSINDVYSKLAEWTDSSTVIIGHGLENDLNVLRVCYDNIVDTAVLYSDNQVNFKRKDPLKKLAWDYLSVNIQAGEHDSIEDAVIPAKIVLKNIQRKQEKKKLLLNSS